MNKEIEYTNNNNSNHIKLYGQYFTNPIVASFMCEWACTGATTMLDPAVGNSIFFKYTNKYNSKCNLKGFEIDKNIIEYFGNPLSADLSNSDYLLNDWDSKYDAIVCNPPYGRFQSIANRNDILNTIYKHTGIKYSAYTNLYILFLIKSIFQLSKNGRLAYIIPTEFLNSNYGTAIKKKLIDERLVKAIITFKNDKEIFYNATTTSCIVLIDNDAKNEILFYTLNSINDLDKLHIATTSKDCLTINYKNIKPDEKWRKFLMQENKYKFKNLVEISKFCKITRGIATGSNDFFCMSNSKIKKYQIPKNSLKKCICKSADIKTPIFTQSEFQFLYKNDKLVFILDINEKNKKDVQHYIEMGEKQSIDKKYLPSHRNPWYSMEQKKIAPIWVSPVGRHKLKFIRNLANSSSLTTFHSIYINKKYEEDTNIIFCYFLTPIAQNIIRENRKELGNGLEKFQPNDLNKANMLDITKLSIKDKKQINDTYIKLVDNFNTSHVNKLNEIFAKYLNI